MSNITDEDFDIFSLYEGGRERVLQEIGLKFRGLRETQGLEKEVVAEYVKNPALMSEMLLNFSHF